MTIEGKVRKHLIAKGYTNEEASLEAFLLVEALRDGSIDPETAEGVYGVSKEEYKKIMNRGGNRNDK